MDEIQSQSSSSKASDPLESLLSSTFSTATSPSSFASPWSTSDITTAKPDEYGDYSMVPRTESIDNFIDINDLRKRGALQTLEQNDEMLHKRPRGRPRKHPITSQHSLSRVSKGRSKTGCITCRKRKKRCDEVRPGCLNCAKNNVSCEGYPESTIWKSGKVKSEEARIGRVDLSTSKLVLPRMPGVETEADMMFLHHYITRLSTVLTVKGSNCNAFKEMILPMASEHPDLMHSILALSGASIDYEEPYGKNLLVMFPQCTVDMLQERSQFHREEAVKTLTKNNVPAVRCAQMLCLIVQAIAEGKTDGEHRLHLQAYKRFIQESKPEEGQFMEFLKGYFSFHSAVDEILSLPKNDDAYGITTLLNFGPSDKFSLCMLSVNKIRKVIRGNMDRGLYPIVDHVTLYRAAEIDAGIRDWSLSWPQGDTSHSLSLLYRQAMWIYLWRTIYPPKTPTWKPDSRITQAVDDSLLLLAKFTPTDTHQNLLLAPTFITGCAAFSPGQREPIRTAMKRIKTYTGFKNSDPALKVLEQVWSYMDEKDERSWDWQSVAVNMGIDILVTSGVCFSFGSSCLETFDDKRPDDLKESVLKKEEEFKSSERIIGQSATNSASSTSVSTNQQNLNIEREIPEQGSMLAILKNTASGKTSPYPSQSQDDKSECSCDTGTESSEDERQNTSMICTDFLVSGITEKKRRLFIDASRTFWNAWNRDFLLIISKCMDKITPYTCGGPSSNYVAQCQDGSTTQSSSTTSNPTKSVDKRKRSDNEFPPDDRGQGPKRPMVDVSAPDDDSSTVRFACPFRKHDPRKYNMHYGQGKWQICAISSWPTVARVKGHLYRRHKEKPRCVRCWLYFQNDEYLKIHLTAQTICPIRPEQPIESVTPDMITRLRCRRNIPEDEEERWKVMYQIIFPDTKDEDVPSPFFEAVTDDLAQPQTSESTDLSLDEIMRQQVPQFVIRRLEVEVRDMGLDDGTSLLDNQGNLQERLATLITRLIHEAQDDASASYRQGTLTNVLVPNQFPTPTDSSSSPRPFHMTTRAPHLRETQQKSSPPPSQNYQDQSSQVSGSNSKNSQNYQTAQTDQATHRINGDGDNDNTPSLSISGLQPSRFNADSIPNLPGYNVNELGALPVHDLQQQYFLPEDFSLMDDNLSRGEIDFDTWCQMSEGN